MKNTINTIQIGLNIAMLVLLTAIMYLKYKEQKNGK